MITVHASSITAVPTTAGLGAIMPSSCSVSQEINGEYELTLTHPKDEYGKWERLVNDNLLYVPTPDGMQLFRIYRSRKNIKGEIEVNARHVFYDLLGNIIESLVLVADTGEQAIDAILAGTQYTSGFTGSSDIAATQNMTIVRYNPVRALLGSDDNTFINRWGGEINRDNFSIAINGQIGADNGRIVRYKKNLTGIDAQEDHSNVVTRIMPTGLNEDDTVLYLDPTKYVDSAHINDYPHPRIKHVHFSDVKVGKLEGGVAPYPSVASARTELDARADALLALGCDLPEISIDVEFRELGDTEEYQQYIQLSTIQLGDTVTVQHDDMDIDLDLRVISYIWDALRGRHERIRLGAKRPNIGQSVTDVDIDLSALRSDYTNAVKQNETYNAVKITHDDGFVAEATINGKTVVVKMNATAGISITVDGDMQFGVDSTGAVFATKIASPADPTNFGIIGNYPGLGSGLALYDLDLSSDPYFQLTATLDMSDNQVGIGIYDTNDVGKMFINLDGTIYLTNVDNTQNIFSYNGSTGEVRLRYGGATNHAIGVDSTGPFKIIGGTKTYL